MEITDALQIAWEEALTVPFDLVVTASGFESRAVHIASQLPKCQRQKRHAMAFTDRQVLAREDNDAQFAILGFISRQFDGGDRQAVLQYVKQLLQSVKRKRISILIDYSCMSKTWYAAILEAIRCYQTRSVNSIVLYFAYSAAKFTKPPPKIHNHVMGPILGFGGLSDPAEKMALILGLGYEPERAQGIVDLLEPSECYAFYTDPAFQKQFARSVRTANKALLKFKLRKECIHTYPSASLQIASCHLTPLCLRLARDNYRIILAPLGPKPFCLLCLILAAKFREFEVWRVSPASRAPAVDIQALGPIMICKVVFENK